MVVLVGFAAAQLPRINTNWRSVLTWNPNPTNDYVDFYTAYVHGPTNFSFPTRNTYITFSNLFGGLPNGEYWIDLTATGFSTLESAPSEALPVFWYGNRPQPPEKPQLGAP
jgi:hypothetical protein